MRTITSTEKVTLKVTDCELLEKKWIPFQTVSNKIRQYEKESNIGYKSLRVKFYNSSSCGKYNENTFAGMKCIDITSPMKEGKKASLELNFERV